MRGRWKTLIPLVATVALLALPSFASAQQVAPFTFTSSFNGAESSAGPLGGEMVGVAINYQSDRIFVLTRGTGHYVVDQFNAAGQAVPFSAPELHGSSSLVLPSSVTGREAAGPLLAVDNSGTGTQGRIYIGSQGGEQIFAYNPDGTAVGGLYPVEERPSGLAVDPATGELVVDENRAVIERFTSAGQRTKQRFRLAGDEWGSQVAVDAEGNIYVAERQGISKYSKTGHYLYLLEGNNGTIKFTTYMSIDPTTGNVFVIGEQPEGTGYIHEYNSRGTQIGNITTPAVGRTGGIAIDPNSGKLYAADNSAQRVDIFSPGAPRTLPEATGGHGKEFEPTQVTLTGSVEPDGVATTECFFEYGPEYIENYGSYKLYEGSLPCSQGQVLTGTGEQTVTAVLSGLTQGAHYHYRLVVRNANGVVTSVDYGFVPSAKPAITGTYVTDVHSDTAELHASINPGGAPTTYHFEYGTSPCSSAPGACTALASASAGAGLSPVPASAVVRGLQGGTTYHYRLVGENQSGIEYGLERTFNTFPPVVTIGTDCPNSHVRQQTGAALLLDCRAYELVSAADTGGYDVESNLVQGQTPFESYPEAIGPSRVLYGTYGGGIPNVGSPTNHGIDPYIATRTEDGWVTSYVGIPANDPIAAPGGPFGSTLLEGSPGLATLAFGGPEICNPCFADGSSGIPVRLANGSLVQGMAGSIPQPAAVPSGHVGRALSADGNHLVFGSTSPFEPAGNNNGDVTIYERDLPAGVTQVASTLPNGATMTGAGIGELDVSADGSRVVVAQQVGEDADHNTLWHPYMHFSGAADSVDLAPGTTSGVYFAGMSEDGTHVFFTTKDKLLVGDTDNGTDLYEATVAGPGQPAALRLVSTGNGEGCTPAEHWNVPTGGGNTCGAVAIGGGAGVSADGNTVYFLSPELLDPTDGGTANQPNLYVSHAGGAPVFVATIDDNVGKSIDLSTVLDAVAQPEVHHGADFQLSSDGRYAAVPSPLSLTAYLSDDHLEVYRIDLASTSPLTCASCAPTNAKASGDASLPVGGLGLLNDGRVFFNSTDALAPRDLDGVDDAYEWEAGEVQLISTGTSQYPSELLGMSADGTDAYFFTHDTLVPQATAGNHMKIYDARVFGGFPFTPEPVPCKASDECHGPSSEPAPSPPTNTLGGEGGSAVPAQVAKKCAKGKVRKKGKCVAKHKKAHKKSSKKKKNRKQGGRHHG
jgi:hypothetical protein